MLFVTNPNECVEQCRKTTITITLIMKLNKNTSETGFAHIKSVRLHDSSTRPRRRFLGL